MSDPVAVSDPAVLPVVDVVARTSVWTLARGAREHHEKLESNGAGFLASRYPRTYACDFVRLFPAAVPEPVWGLVRIWEVLRLWRGVGDVRIIVARAQMACAPQSRDAAHRAVVALSVWEGISLADAQTKLADAFMDVMGLTRPVTRSTRPDPAATFVPPDLAARLFGGPSPGPSGFTAWPWPGEG